MANPTYTGKRAKLSRDRAEFISCRGNSIHDHTAGVRKADARAAELKAQGCKVRIHYGTDVVTLSIWDATA